MNPGRCPLCLGPLARRDELCPQCRSLLPWLAPAPRDPGPILQPETGTLIKSVVAPLAFAWPVNRLLQQLKYQRRLELARLFGLELAAQVRAAGVLESQRCPECVVPVPQSVARWRERGFNPAAEIAVVCAGALGLECAPDMVLRHDDAAGLAAMGLSAEGRRLALVGVFAVQPQVAGRRVAIVDDVLTSGATSHSLAEAVQDAGGEVVSLWVVARTVLGIEGA